MNNLQQLYDTDMAFADIVDEAAAAAIGTTNVEFAAEWLKLPADEKPVGDVVRLAAAEEQAVDHRMKPGWNVWDEIAELERKVVELTDELDVARGKNKAYKLHIARMQDGRNGWHVKAEKMQKQVDELNARVEQMRMQLGAAADYAGAILRACMDCTDYAVVDNDGEVVA